MSKESLAGIPGVDPEDLDDKGTQQPGAEQAQQPAAQDVEIEDVDELELRTAMADVGAEEPEGQLQPAKDDTDPTLKPPAAATDPKPEDQTQRQPVMIAKPRFDEVLQQRKIAEENFARERAEKLLLQQELAKLKPAAVDPQLSQIDSQIDELAGKFDAGEITYKDMIAQQRTLQAQRDQIREDAIVNRAAQRAAEATPAAPSGDDGWLADRDAEVVAQYGPYIEAVPQFMFNGLVEQAKANLIATNGSIPRGARGDAMVRQEFGRLAFEGHEGFARMAGTAPIQKPAGNGQPQPRTTPGTQPTADQRRAKLELQERMPPGISQMQRSTGSDTMLTESQIEEMDEEAIAALPAATRNRLLGIE